ncbi:MYND finger domain-like protein [Mycena venus]|uniref:MYND finger domain-like protein n=1 Tax=Mycena venus TaxID=2733690 RepID=A0A8H7D845_9AGAR|nr:MYND finger domain-like protein [Mycena venus]
MDCLDVCYKKIGQIPIYLNVYAPSNLESQSPYPRLPAVVYFHGGGLTVGNRTSWFPGWLKARIVDAGFVLISADYRLIPSCTVHDIIDDIKDLFLFLSQDDLCFKTESARLFGIDPSSLAVAGSSAGGMCAYLAAIHASPKPKAVLGMYAMGGQIFSRQSLTPKSEVFYRNRELLDPAEFTEFIYPECKLLQPITDSALAYHPASHPTRPGWWANPRMALARLYLQLGVMLDYCTGQHEPSLSAQLRPLLETAAAADPLALQEAMKALIPPEHHSIFPQLNVTAQFPPTFLCHGSEDGAVSVEESHHMHSLLKRVGVPVRLLVIDGANHSLDYVPNAEKLYASHFDEMAEFLKQSLTSA